MKNKYLILSLAMFAWSTLQSNALLAQNDCDLTGVVAVTAPSCGNNDGMLDLTPIGGVPPYFYQWSTGETTQDIANVGVGSYWVFFVDSSKDCAFKIDVEVTCEDNCIYRTQTQGGWGSPGNGNNPGVYRDANFATCFPNGLTIGCTRTLTLTSALAVKNFLPSGTTPKMLPVGAAIVDPGNSYKNVLAGQLVAAMLSVGFDACDPDFGASSGLLGNLTIAYGMFQGWTVQELIDEANDFIGGCGSNYTASQLNSALTLVNENYVDGTTDNGYLLCTSTGDDKAILTGGAADAFHVWPNPANDVLTLDMNAAKDGRIAVTLTDVSGRVALPARTFSVEAGQVRRSTMDVSGLPNGTYLLAMQSEQSNTVRTIVIAR